MREKCGAFVALPRVFGPAVASASHAIPVSSPISTSEYTHLLTSRDLREPEREGRACLLPSLDPSFLRLSVRG